MYTGVYETRRRRSKRHKKVIYLPLILLNLILLAVCVFLVGKALESITDLFSIQQAVSFLPTEAANMKPKDTTPPEIIGVHDFTIYAGDTIAYRSGVSITDEADPAPVLNVDSKSVDVSLPGSYTVTYTATDASGNCSSAQANVTVLPKQAGFVDLETIDDAAAAVLDQILWPQATTREQVCAIYAWARSHISYGGHSDRTDWRQTAYTVLQELRGDCYGYFAVTKLMFEKLGIPNIDVQKIKSSEKDSAHFWSLVSIDGGQTYYHFDATPRIGEGDNFCLVTDAFLDAYSAKYKNSHNRDKSLYPATPKEDLR